MVLVENWRQWRWEEGHTSGGFGTLSAQNSCTMNNFENHWCFKKVECEGKVYLGNAVCGSERGAVLKSARLTEQQIP